MYERETPVEVPQAPERGRPAVQASVTRSPEAGLLALQGSAGNAAVVNLLRQGVVIQRDVVREAGQFLRGVRRVVTAAQDPCSNLARADAFVGHGPYGPEDVIGDGGLGGFTSTYEPGTGPGKLTALMRVAVRFRDPLLVDPVTGLVTPALPEMAGLAAAINLMPEPLRTAAVIRYQWAAAERGDAGTWIASLRPLIESQWSGQFQFFLNLAQHEWIGSTVDVDLDVHDRARIPADHLELETWKLPPGESLRTFGLSHNVASGSAADARDQTMQLASTSLGPKEYDLLKSTVLFGNDSDVLTPAVQASLTSFIATFDGALGHAAHQEVRVVLEAHASGRGNARYNLDLSRRRADAVRDFLVNNGFHNVATRVTEDPRGEAGADAASPDNPADRRVDLLVDGGGRMVTAVHEFGHAFGLDDEYATAGAPIGSTPSHDESAAAMTDALGRHLPGAATEHNGGIMSWGNEVRPRHYATFYKALAQVTGEPEWALGSPTPRATAQAACAAAAPPAGAVDAGTIDASVDEEAVRP
jgi:outer membrane protein OmpA-like peptidoglycan-associated protein